MDHHFITDQDTARIEEAFADLPTRTDLSDHERTVLRVGRLAIRRRNAGLSWNEGPVLDALSIAQELLLESVAA